MRMAGQGLHVEEEEEKWGHTGQDTEGAPRVGCGMEERGCKERDGRRNDPEGQGHQALPVNNPCQPELGNPQN